MLAIIGLTLAGGVLLLWVCWKMYRELRSHGQDEVAPDEAIAAAAADTGAHQDLRRRRLADPGGRRLHVAGQRAGRGRRRQGSPDVLIIGLLLSVVLMGAAANMVAHLLHKHRWIGWIGLLIITYVALDMIWRGSEEVLKHTAALGLL